MEYLWQIHYDYNWGGLFRNVVLLGMVLGACWFALWYLRRLPSAQEWQRTTERLLSYFLLLFEPLAVLVLGSYFVLIHPFFHGLIVLLLLVTCFQHLKNYFGGRVVRFDSAIRIGNRLSSQEETGLITRIGRLGLRLQGNDGIHFLDYNRLLKEGYTLLNSDDSGSFFALHVSSNNEGTPQEEKRLRSLLIVNPFLDWQHEPQITPSTAEDTDWLVKLALYDEKHLTDFIKRLAEDQFSVQTAKI